MLVNGQHQTKHSLLHWLSLLAIPIAALACADDETTTPPTGGRADEILALMGDATAGEVDFPSTCGLGASPCHEPDGTDGGGLATDLTAETANLTDREIVETVLNGVGQMPPQSSLDNQTIADIVAFMRNEWGQ
jgi:mono/diheme cytochrome c family protein